MNRSAALRPLLLAGLALACGSDPATVERGRALFQEPWNDGAGQNFYSCATCHAEAAGAPPLRASGAPLAGAPLRPWFWGGQEHDLLRAVNACRTYFMDASAPLSRDEPDAVALYAFLEQLEPRDENPVSFSVVRSVEDVPRGDAKSGALLYTSVCAGCHGGMGDGAGALAGHVPVLPDEALRQHRELTPRMQRLVFIEKTRHGGFLGYGGVMPPFSLEALSDAELADILEALGLTGE